MTDVRDPSSIVESARTAVGDGDYPAAERLLREAAAVQEATLGASHPDLATTLNNLAFVCERMEKFDEAERGYRRAHAIAVASLSPGHPFIKTSLTNLVEFCAARGIPIWTPPAAPAEDEHDEDAPLDSGIDRFEPERVPKEASVPVVVASRMTSRAIAAAALGIAAMAIVLFARQGQGKTETSAAAAAPAAESKPMALSPASKPGFKPDLRPGSKPDPKPDPEPDPTPSASVTVLTARLCSALEKTGSPDWQCATVNGDGQPGTYVFYTRLLTNEPTTVEHRWYVGGRLHQAMTLRVAPNSAHGYRTFSSNRVSPERAGDWKVELRAVDGTLLDEARFVVR